jgi:hypothetical protein
MPCSVDLPQAWPSKDPLSRLFFTVPLFLTRTFSLSHPIPFFLLLFFPTSRLVKLALPLFHSQSLVQSMFLKLCLQSASFGSNGQF